jgi:hypothetical protein
MTLVQVADRCGQHDNVAGGKTISQNQRFQGVLSIPVRADPDPGNLVQFGAHIRTAKAFAIYRSSPCLLGLTELSPEKPCARP